MLGEKIEKIRKIKGISQEYIASKLSISQNAYSKMERGEIKITAQHIPLICDLLEIDPNTLFNFEPSMIFHNCTSSGQFNNSNINNSDLIKELYEKLLFEKDSKIKQLEDELKRIKTS